MSAAAHLLRRQSSLLLQRRHKIHALSIPSLVTPVKSRNPLAPSIVGHRKFSASTTSQPPKSSTSESSSFSGSKVLKYATAGAAFLLVSSAAWYTIRDDSTQVQHFSLPQIFHGRFQEEKAPSQIDEKSLSFVQSSEVHEGVREDVVRESGEAISHQHEQTHEGRPSHEVSHDSKILKENVETEEVLLKKASPEPPGDVEQVFVVSEHDSRPEEPQWEGIPASKASEQPSKETVQEQTQPSEADELEDQNVLETVVDVVKDKVVAAKDFLFNESNDVSDERDETTDIRDVSKDEILPIRERLQEEYPEMFNLDQDINYIDDSNHEDDEDLEDVPQVMEEVLVREETKAVEEISKVVGVDVLIGAIETAKQLQAEVDDRTFQEQLHKIKEAHTRELKDVQAKILAYAEGTDQLEKELKKEKEEAAAALKLQEETAEERLQSILKQKEEEASEEIERLQLLEKALAAASFTREKADHLEEIHSLQLQVDALRTAFYTRSAEARISHTAHKLTMGAFALENAIARGEAVEKEADLLITSAGGPGVDPLVDAVVSSLPSEVLTVGSVTRAQLYQKFSRLKGSLRELALMPFGGGGVFAHFLARVTANLKIGEQGSDAVENEGIEVVIGKVERLLADGKLVEAAAVLETGARGTAAEGLAVEWANQARNRAIIEQGLQVLRAHVIVVASGLS